MDYDDNEFQGQNIQLAGERCSKISPVLCSYPLPNFDFDDSIHGHFENEVFLGITNQEDSHWIEEYSRINNGVEFSSSAVESRCNNVWSEATSPESVEMLLKSVGQEDNSAGKIKIENLDVCNETCSLTKVMDPNSNQESEKVSTSIVEKHDLSVLEEKVGNTFDDAIQNEPENLSNELTNKEPPHVPRVEYLGSSSVDDLMVRENLQQVSVSASDLSENVSNVEKSLSFVPNIVKNSSTDTSSIQVSDNPSQKSKSKDIDSLESNTGSLTIASAMKIIENESAIEKDEFAIHVSQDVSFNEIESASLPPERSDMDIEVVRALDNQKNVEPFSLLESSKENTKTAHNFQSDVSVQIEQVAFTESDTNETDDQPKSPIFGVSLVHQDNKEKTEVVFQSQTEVDQPNSGSKDPSSLVEKEDSHRVVEKKLHGSDFHNVTPVESCNASQIEQEPETSNGRPSDLSEVKAMNSQKESMIEVNNSNEHESSLPSKITDDVEDKIQSVSLSNATHEEKSFTFNVNKSGDLGEASKDIQSYPAFQASNSPKITDGPSTDYSISQLDAEKLHGISRSPQNPSGLVPQTKVKGKSERKPRRKSTGKENAKKTTPETGQVTRFEEVKSHENVERSSTKPGAALSSPKLPDLNNSTAVFQQPFTDNQQVQLRAQILVYGSLISGSPPEEAHMVAAFGQSDGARTWDSVWHACLERLHLQKAQSKSNNSIQAHPVSRDAGSRADKGIKHASIQNKIPTSPVIGPMIPLSSPLWNMSTPSDNMQSSVMPRTGGHLDHHHSLSALHPTYQTPPIQNFSGHNSVSWLSQGPFSGQWAARFPALPITPIKESSGPSIRHSPKQTIHNSSFLSGMKATATPNLPSSDSKGRKRKKGIIPAVSAPCSSSVVVSVPSHDPKNGHQNMEKVVISEESFEESKIQALEATKYADDATRHCHNLWRQLETQYCSGLNPDNEAKLVSSAISIAAAASVAKVAAVAAKIASDIADQARSMVNAFSSSKSQNLDQSSMISLSLNRFDKATPDAIVKAVELAAEAVSQAGKIVAMSEPLPLKHLVEAGPEGYWKKNVETAPQVSDKGIPTAKYDSSGKETSQDSGKNHTVEVDGISVSLTSQENDKRKPRFRKVPEFSNTIEVVPELEMGSIGTSGGQIEPEVPLKESNIKEGCLVEVYKDDDKPNTAWFGGNVLSLKDGKALVCYTDIQSTEGKLKEWVPLEVEGSGVPKIRVAHHPMGLKGTKKRRRTSATDFLWSTGDRVDVWMQDRWREGVVMETNKIDVTSLTVQFPGEGEATVVRSWFVRPTLFWKDGKWIDSRTSAICLSSQGDTPQHKRLKLGIPVLESKANDGYGSLESFDLVDSSKQKELRTLNLSTHESVFSIGSTRDEKLNTHPTTRSGFQKESPRVIFGVPKPGKKQKFMDVSKHYVADKANKSKTAHDSSVKFTKYLIPQAPGSRGWKMDSRSDTKEKQAAEIESRIVKPRKPPIPVSKTSKSTISRDHNKVIPDSHNHGDQPGHQNPVDIGSFSNIQSAPDLASSLGIPKRDSTKSERSKKRKFAPIGGKPTKVEKSQPELAEPRRSNRKIQPTSRLLEGLQSSMTISKIPSAAHFTQKSYKVTQKGNTNNA